MASNHHHHHPCHLRHPSLTTTCYCTACYSTTHYSPPPPPFDPLLHSTSSYHHPQSHLYPPPYNHHTHQKHHLSESLPQQHHHNHPEPPPLAPTVSSLLHRITTLESSLLRRHRSPRPPSLRDAAARLIQTHFRAFLVRRSRTLRHLRDLAAIKRALNTLKSSVAGETHFDSRIVSRESMSLLIKLDSIQGNDPMIRDGKRSVSRELIRFMKFIDEISPQTRPISAKNGGRKPVVLQREHKIRVSGSRVSGRDTDNRKILENLRIRIEKINGFSTKGEKDEEAESLELENPSSYWGPQDPIGGFLNSQGVVKSRPKGKKNVKFAENGSVYRVMRSSHGSVQSDESESVDGDGEAQEIGVSSRETKEDGEDEEDNESSETSKDEIDPRENLRIRNALSIIKQRSVLDQHDDDCNDDEDDDSFVFCAPLPEKMEYGVDLVKKEAAGVRQ